MIVTGTLESVTKERQVKFWTGISVTIGEESFVIPENNQSRDNVFMFRQPYFTVNRGKICFLINSSRKGDGPLLKFSISNKSYLLSYSWRHFSYTSYNFTKTHVKKEDRKIRLSLLGHVNHVKCGGESWGSHFLLFEMYGKLLMGKRRFLARIVWNAIV